ncbi:YkoF family thiamine/hydroxymethylpyrimidine-binding protein [Paracerasibacillus soli]|uniref:YkoF family thiamine/hydroxymethylpyrimidine-binding protein n=1 Tax=Paracerasibacillus soli TaxID=480284 RepID=A0ABU5CY04_9BACI|nr:YkoF family thiamine/hydroxymethylpyrimidine-binding protein [Virgibacillus soli]MDY0410365.1 YkoF family thiamine/hydroxymethylpyrimidine-binding protein [Virgibacillus soli]
MSGDSAGDVYLIEDDNPVNVQNTGSIKQYIAAKFSLYPLGGGQYMDVIYEQIEAMKDFVSVSPAHYATRLTGDAQNVFSGLEKVFNATKNAGSTHTVMTVTISANSPSHQDVDIHA